MIPCMCLVQKGQISAETEATLRAEMESFAQKNFGDSAEFNWMTVPENSGFTAGEPSTSVLVSMQSNRQLSKTDRTTLLAQLCDIWMTTADRSINEVVASISDPLG